MVIWTLPALILVALPLLPLLALPDDEDAKIDSDTE